MAPPVTGSPLRDLAAALGELQQEIESARASQGRRCLSYTRATGTAR